MVKNFIINLAVVVIVVFAIDFALGRVLRYFYFKETSDVHFRTTYAMEKTNADILIFGSSRANHHYVPELFEDSLGMSFYNTGRDGNGVFYQLAVLRSVLKRYTPEIIIFDFAGGFGKGEEDYVRMSSLLPYYRTHDEIKDIIELKGPFERIKLISEIYPFNSQVLKIAMGNLEINKIRKSDNKGYIPLYKEWQAKIDSIAYPPNVNVDSVKLLSFREFINVAKKSGIKVVVTYSPVFLRTNKNPDIEICKDICSLENVPFWDYSKDTSFLNNKHLFQDVGHLNHNGAIIFSKIVVEKIQRCQY